MPSDFLDTARQQFLYYKTLGEKAMAQLQPEMLFIQPPGGGNSIAMIIQHMHGNMLSRWSDFLSSDGEKEWRQRDAEFEVVLTHQEEVMEKWNEGWESLMNALSGLDDGMLDQTVLIRNEPHSVVAAINRQLAHYPYHVGQIVYFAKQLVGDSFTSLSIPKNGSKAFNQEKFGT